MKNVISALVQAYYDIIYAANIQFAGARMPIYDTMAPSSELGSFILIGERQAKQIDNKYGYSYDANILIQVIVKNGNFGTKDADDVAAQIGLLVNQKNNPDLSPDFQCISTDVTWSTLNDLNPTTPVFRTLIRFHHKICQV